MQLSCLLFCTGRSVFQVWFSSNLCQWSLLIIIQVTFKGKNYRKQLTTATLAARTAVELPLQVPIYHTLYHSFYVWLWLYKANSRWMARCCCIFHCICRYYLYLPGFTSYDTDTFSKPDWFKYEGTSEFLAVPWSKGFLYFSNHSPTVQVHLTFFLFWT